MLKKTYYRESPKVTPDKFIILQNIHDKIFNQFHKTRLTHDLYLTLEPEEVILLLNTLRRDIDDLDRN